MKMRVWSVLNSLASNVLFSEIKTMTSKRKYQDLLKTAEVTISTHDYTPWDAIAAGYDNALQTARDGDVVEGSEEFWQIALDSIAQSVDANAVSDEHYNALKTWFQSHGHKF